MSESSPNVLNRFIGAHPEHYRLIMLKAFVWEPELEVFSKMISGRAIYLDPVRMAALSIEELKDYLAEL